MVVKLSHFSTACETETTDGTSEATSVATSNEAVTIATEESESTTEEGTTPASLPPDHAGSLKSKGLAFVAAFALLVKLA